MSVNLTKDECLLARMGLMILKEENQKAHRDNQSLRHNESCEKCDNEISQLILKLEQGN